MLLWVSGRDSALGTTLNRSASAELGSRGVLDSSIQKKAMAEGKDDRGTKKWRSEGFDNQRENKRVALEQARRDVHEAKTLPTKLQKASTSTRQKSKTETEKEDNQQEMWTIHVSNAVSGEGIGKYVLAPTDLVQDLKTKLSPGLRARCLFSNVFDVR